MLNSELEAKKKKNEAKKKTKKKTPQVGQYMPAHHFIKWTNFTWKLIVSSPVKRRGKG